MQHLTVSALLTDAAGLILLVRRKGSALWRLPGSVIRSTASVGGMLVSLCRRQAGVAPDFVAPFFDFEFSGRRVVVGRDEIRHEQARACGWVEAVQWFRRDALPVGIEPFAAVAISLSAATEIQIASVASGLVPLLA